MFNPEVRYLYFITDSKGRYKIGFSGNPIVRMDELQRGNPLELKIVRSYKTKDYIHFEKKVHEYLKEYNIRSEWFKLNKKQLKDVYTKLETGYFNGR